MPTDITVEMPPSKFLFTEEAQESAIKDLWDSFYLGLQKAWYGTRQALFSIIPQAVVSFFTPATDEELSEMGVDPSRMKGVREGLQKQTDEMLETLTLVNPACASSSVLA